MTAFDRKIFFDNVRDNPFPGRLTQQQVDGMSFKLDVWEAKHAELDLRWLAYALATSMHETASAMWPCEEVGKGKGQPYGTIVKETGFAYYGRGDVQLTWDYNYKNATTRLGLANTDDDLYWHADRALDPKISADVMYMGMIQGWFRANHALAMYFNDTTDDPYNARDIINGDKKTVPSWSHGVSIGNLIAGYHRGFVEALEASLVDQPSPPPVPEAEQVIVDITAPAGVLVRVNINGQAVALS